MEYINSKKTLLDIKNNGVNSEFTSLDYKRCFRFSDHKDKLEVVKDIVSFANTEGGYIIYGVEDKTYDWIGLDSSSDPINDIQINSFLLKYVSEPIDFKVGQYNIDGDIFYLLSIEKYRGSDPVAFIADGEYDQERLDGSFKKRHVFSKGDVYGRVSSSSTRVNDDKTFYSLRKTNNRIVTNLNGIPRPYKQYVPRPDDLEALIEPINNPNIRSVQVNGLGGIGKTSFVRNFCDEIINRNIKLRVPIQSIVWITGKLDVFNPNGEISPIRNSELSFVEVLDIFANTFSIDTIDKTDEDISKEIYDNLLKYPTLVVIDNVETIKDDKVLSFVKNVPSNTRVIFTTRTDMTTIYSRIDLNGFNQKQFNEYLKNLLMEYCPNKWARLYETVSPYLKDLNDLTQGSPIMAMMIAFKISRNNNVETLVNQLHSMKKDNNYYDKVMDFCFSSTFDELMMIDKKILLVMSFSDIKDEQFSVNDLVYILKSDESDINDSLGKLSSVSFCIQDNQNYICQSLVKVFITNKYKKDKAAFGDAEKISNKYYDWANKKQAINAYEISVFNRAKAYNFERKVLVMRVKELIYRYDSIKDYEFLSKEFEKLISSNPDYSYLYFEKARIDISADADPSSVILNFKNAIKNDKSNDYYYGEYAFYCLKRGSYGEAIDLFEAGLKINPDASNLHFGIALSMSKFYNGKQDFYSRSDEIINHFEKSYVAEGERSTNFKNARTAHAHASYLFMSKKYNDALMVCENGLKWMPRDTKLNTLYGNIMSKIDPNYISKTKIKSIKSGVFASASDEDIMKLLNIIDE